MRRASTEYTDDLTQLVEGRSRRFAHRRQRLAGLARMIVEEVESDTRLYSDHRDRVCDDVVELTGHLEPLLCPFPSCSQGIELRPIAAPALTIGIPFAIARLTGIVTFHQLGLYALDAPFSLAIMTVLLLGEETAPDSPPPSPVKVEYSPLPPSQSQQQSCSTTPAGPPQPTKHPGHEARGPSLEPLAETQQHLSAIGWVEEVEDEVVGERVIPTEISSKRSSRSLVLWPGGASG